MSEGSAESNLRQLKPHSAYKRGSTPWLESIPAHWELKPLKAVLQRNDSGVWGDDATTGGTVVLRSTEQTVDGTWNIERPATRLLHPRDAVFARLEIGDLVVTKSSGSELHIGKTTIVDESVAALSCAFSNFMQRLRLKRNEEPRFYWYLLNSPVVREQLVYLSSTTTGLGNLSGRTLDAVQFARPVRVEQQAIVHFLDNQIGRIDALIAKKERLLELLHEKRTSFVTRVVTRGLDPNAALRDSGVSWLGGIPCEWQCGALRRFWKVIDCKHRTATYVSEGYPVVSTTEVKPGRLRLDGRRRVTQEDFQDLIEGGRQPRRGDVIYSRNASLGSAAYVDTDLPFCMGQDVCLITSEHDGHYLMYQLNSRAVTSQLGAQSVGSTFERINVDAIKDLIVVCPPADEQERIAQFLDRADARIDALVEQVWNGIVALRELRAALITSAVTGAINVAGIVHES